MVRPMGSPNNEVHELPLGYQTHDNLSSNYTCYTFGAVTNYSILCQLSKFFA